MRVRAVAGLRVLWAPATQLAAERRETKAEAPAARAAASSWNSLLRTHCYGLGNYGGAAQGSEANNSDAMAKVPFVPAEMERRVSSLVRLKISSRACAGRPVMPVAGGAGSAPTTREAPHVRVIHSKS